MLEAAGWYLALLFVGGAGLVPAALLCGRLPSAGTLLARPLALALVSLTAWFVASLGVLPYGTPLIVAVVLLLYAWGGLLCWRRPALLRAVVERRRWLLVGEALFLVVFVLVAFARAQAPAAIGTEKPMDLMLIAAVHEASSLPPPDPWLAGRTLSYYYLGHLAADAVGRLSANPPAVAFNLVTASAGAMAAAGVAALAVDVATLRGRRRRRTPWVAGGVGVATLLLVTPLAGLAPLAAANGLGGPDLWSRLGVEAETIAAGATDGVPNAWWWWWSNTRILPGTITEFPAFTLLLGDPHAHLLALPLALVAVALAVVAFEGGSPLTWRAWFREPSRLAFTAMLFAAIFLTNAWDVVIFGALWAGGALVAFRRAGWPWLLGAVGVARWAAVPAGVALLLAWPFLDSADLPRLGVAAVTGEHSDPARWLLVWLPPALPAVAALFLLRPGVEARTLARGMLVAVTPVTAWIAVAVAQGDAGEVVARGSGWAVVAGLVLAGGALGAMAAGADRRRDTGLAGGLALLGAVVAIVGLTELLRVDDAFPGRLNTVFKLWFASWTLLAVAAGALAGLAADRATLPEARLPRLAAAEGLAVAGILLALSALYVPAMAVSRAREGQAPGLDATAHLHGNDPGLAAVIAWSRVHLDPGDHVVVQAVGESYTAGNMLSAATGVPTLLGWPNHQRQWRSAIPEADRRAEVEMLYLDGATAENATLARRLGVTHVYVGREERIRYGDDVGSRFDGWPVLVEANGALLVQVP
ncbi:MAG: DUF2298 domain-containing protein [Dehalococcoidia bacterium]